MTESFRLHTQAAVRRPQIRPRGRFPVLVVHAHPVAMWTALRLAGWDARRIRVLSASEVLVLNQPRAGVR